MAKKTTRKAKIERKTTETDISVEINLDGSGRAEIDTPIGFINHMLELCAYHGSLDLRVRAYGDLQVDYHHLMEDLGICIGQALNRALGDKKGIRRFGFAKVPMDESLAEVVIDISGRPYLLYRIKKRGLMKDMPVSLFRDFFRALSVHAMMNLHIILHYGEDLHHIFEAVFKAFGRAIKEATEVVSGRVPSTNGTI
jgi:imidazoleglycerol-phosphate dehydratase